MTTLVIWLVLEMAPKMGKPTMDIVDLLGSMFGKLNQALGWMMHLNFHRQRAAYVRKRNLYPYTRYVPRWTGKIAIMRAELLGTFVAV